MKTALIKPILLGILVFVLGGCVNVGKSDSYASEDLGLRKTNLLNEDISLSGFSYVATPAGEAQNIARSFENAPPLIPHDVEGMMEITRDFNMCTSCHLPEVAVEAKATSMPKTHFVSIITNKDLGDKMDEARYNCTQCHVPQADGVVPIVANVFKAEFRNKDGGSLSNLIDNINEGIK